MNRIITCDNTRDSCKAIRSFSSSPKEFKHQFTSSFVPGHDIVYSYCVIVDEKHFVIDFNEEVREKDINEWSFQSLIQIKVQFNEIIYELKDISLKYFYSLIAVINQEVKKHEQ